MRQQVQRLWANQLVRGTGVFLGGNVLVNLGAFIYHVLMARMLGPIEYGILGSLIGLTYFVSVPTGAIDLLVVKVIATFPKGRLLGRIKSFLIYLAAKLVKWLLALALILAVITIPVTNFLHLQSFGGVVLVWVGIYFLVASVVGLAALRVMLQFGQVVVNQILGMGLRIGFSVGLIMIGMRSYLGAQWGLTLSLLAALGILTYQLRPVWRAAPVEIEPAKFRLRTLALTSLLFSVAFVSMYSLDIILVRHFLPQFEAGIYASLATAGKIVFFALSPIAVVLLPLVARKTDTPQAARTDLLVIVGIALGGGLVVVATFFGLAKLIVNVLFTSQFAQASIYLPWVGLAMWGYSLANIFGNFLMALNRTRVIAVATCGLVLEVVSIALFHTSLWQVVWGLTAVFWVLAGVLFIFSWLATQKI